MTVICSSADPRIVELRDVVDYIDILGLYDAPRQLWTSLQEMSRRKDR